MPQFIPNLLEIESNFGGKVGFGILLTNVFSIPIQNTQNHPLTIEMKLEVSKGLEGK